MKNSAKLLQKFLGEAPLLIDDANKQFSGLSESQINWKPSEERWSIGECIEHLVVTHKLYNSKSESFNQYLKIPARVHLNLNRPLVAG